MSRNFEQIFLSKETDSWNRQWHGSIGTVIGGTVSLTVAPTTGKDQQFMSGLSFSSNLANCSVSILNGTAYLFHMVLQSADEHKEVFETPLKSSQGTAMNIEIHNLWGTANFNAQGYTVK